MCARGTPFFSHHYPVDIMWGNKLKYDWSGKWLCVVMLYKLVKHCNYAPVPGVKCLPLETATEICTTHTSLPEIQCVFTAVFNHYILQLHSQHAPSLWQSVIFHIRMRFSQMGGSRVIDWRSVQMMCVPCDCFPSHYSQSRVISKPAADMSAWASDAVVS